MRQVRRVNPKQRDQYDLLEIGGKASTNTTLLGRGIDRDEDEVGFKDSLVDVGREEQVTAARLLDDFEETGFVDGEVKVGRVPSIDASLVEVNNGDLDMRTLEGDHCTSGASDVACKGCLLVSLSQTRDGDAHRHRCSRSS